jgi:hypothetical protein
MMIQLDPYIPVWVSPDWVDCVKGTGYAIGWSNFSQEHHLIWHVAMDIDGSVWEVPNPYIRLQKNFSIGRKL